MRTRLGLLLTLLALPGLAGAQSAPTVQSIAVDAPPPVRPGESFDAPMHVQYCYSNASPAIKGTVQVSVLSTPSWATASVNPASFPADGSGACGARDVTLHVALTRGAPAFTSEFVQLQGVGRGSTGSTSPPKDAPVPVQADYWAEVQATQRDRPSVQRGDLGRFTLVVEVRANAGTRLEITGDDPTHKLSLQGALVDARAGDGLDKPVTQDVPLTVTADPMAPLGVQSLPVRITTHYANRPDFEGQGTNLTIAVNVGQADAGSKPLPGPGAALVVAAVGALAVAAARRSRP